MKLVAVLFGAAALGASLSGLAPASAGPRRAQPAPAEAPAPAPPDFEQEDYRYDCPPGYSVQQQQRYKYDCAGTAGRMGLGASPYRPEGPGNVVTSPF